MHFKKSPYDYSFFGKSRVIVNLSIDFKNIAKAQVPDTSGTFAIFGEIKKEEYEVDFTNKVTAPSYIYEGTLFYEDEDSTLTLYSYYPFLSIGIIPNSFTLR